MGVIDTDWILVTVISASEVTRSSQDPNLNCVPLGMPFPKRAILVLTPQRMIRLTAPEEHSHRAWLLALRYVAIASSQDLASITWVKMLQEQLSVLEPLRFNHQYDQKDVDYPRVRMPPFHKKQQVNAQTAEKTWQRPAGESRRVYTVKDKPLPITPRSSAKTHTRQRSQSVPVAVDRDLSRPDSPFSSMGERHKVTNMFSSALPWTTPRTPQTLRRNMRRTSKSSSSSDSLPSVANDRTARQTTEGGPIIQGASTHQPRTLQANTDLLPSAARSPATISCTRPQSSVTSSQLAQRNLDDHVTAFENLFRAGRDHREAQERRRERERSERGGNSTAASTPHGRR